MTNRWTGFAAYELLIKRFRNYDGLVDRRQPVNLTVRRRRWAFMFKKLVEGAAAKASLVNIKFDLDQLAESFPHSASRASNAIFKLLENLTLAFSNNASEADVQHVLDTKSATFPPEVKEIVNELFQLVLATRSGDIAAINTHDSRINEIFVVSTGDNLDATKAPWFSKLAVRMG